MANYELAVPIRIGTRFHIASVRRHSLQRPFSSWSSAAKSACVIQSRNSFPTTPRQRNHSPSAAGPCIGDPRRERPSGLRHDRGGCLTRPASLVARFRDQSARLRPGSRYSYSNSNYNPSLTSLSTFWYGYGEFWSKNIFALCRPYIDRARFQPREPIAGSGSGYVPVGAIAWPTRPTSIGRRRPERFLYSTAEDLFPLDRALHRWQSVARPERRPDVHSPARGVGYG